MAIQDDMGFFFNPSDFRAEGCSTENINQSTVLRGCWGECETIKELEARDGTELHPLPQVRQLSAAENIQGVAFGGGGSL